MNHWPPSQDARIREAVLSVLDRGLLVDGPEVKRLESEFEKMINVEFAVAVSSGTAAITAALLAAGVKAGDRVVVPALTFSGSVLPIIHIGAIPVFVDVDPRTFCLDPFETAKVAIRVQASAIVLVHLHGYPVVFPEEIRSKLDEVGIIIVEDACQALGVGQPSEQGSNFGIQGIAAAFSFNEKKQVFAGEGGIVATSSNIMAEKIKRLRRYGEPINQPGSQWRSYVSLEIGYNWKLGEIQAAIARVSLSDLSWRCKLSQKNAAILTQYLKETRLTPPVSNEGEHAWHKYRVLCNPVNRDNFVHSLKEHGVPVSLWQTEILPLMPAFEKWATSNESDYKWAKNIIAGSFIIGDEYTPLYGTESSEVVRWAETIKEICS